MSSGMESRAVREATEGTWPLLPKERNWGTWGLTGVALSSGVAAWSYMIGGYVANYLNAAMGTMAMIAGSLVGMLFVVLATVPPSVRYGVDTITASRPQFGTRGSYFTIFLQYASIIGWNALLLILLGRAISSVAISTGMAQESNAYIISIVGSLVAIFISWLLLRSGADTIRKSSLLIAVLVTVIGVWILVRLFLGFGISAIAEAKPLASSGDRLWDYTAGFEILVASVLSWWPYMGGIVRMVPSTRQAIWPAMFAMGLPTGVISLIGLYSALVTGDPDPTKWLLQVGGVTYGVFALVFLAMANIGTAIVGAYVAGIGLKQISYVQKKLNWNLTSALVLLPVAVIAVFIPNLFFDHIGTFLAFLGVFFAPVVGIQIVDYFFLRKQELNVMGLYDNSSKSPYYFWKGINPAAFAAVIIGFVAYVYLLNPVTYVSHGPFKYISASVPVILISAGVFYVVTRLLAANSNIGDYSQNHNKLNSKQVKA